ncbi:MAG: bi-domain-containing oxidoreductase [Anaerolineaceae bacterium]|nr:bi-domain-containing oxidoreductase [Anaerolineaceae bacterium]
MKQLLQNMKNGEAVVLELPVPDVQPGTALVRTAASLVSAGTERMVVEFAEKSLVGKARSRPDLVKQILDRARREGVLSTLEAAFNRLEQPMALGYSSAGTIAALGEGMQEYHIGQRVACAGGGYAVHAEYAVIPKNLLTPLTENVDFEEAAFTTVGAIAMQGFRLAELKLGERVAIIGLGLLGLLSVEICEAAGCQVFGIDLDEKRVDVARQLGAEAALRNDVEAIAASFTGGVGFDAVLICADTTSNDPVWLGGQIARERGKIVAIGAVGMNIPRKVYYQKELEFIVSRSYGPGRYDSNYEEGGVDYPISYVRWTEGRNMESFVALLASKKIDVSAIISHRFSIEEAAKAYSLITGKEEESFLGVLLKYPVEEKFAVRRKIEVNKKEPSQAATSLSLGVLGAGNYAKAVFLPIVKKTGMVQKHTIISGAGMTATNAAKRYGFQYASSREEDVLENDAVNIIAILNRHQFHASQVMRGLAAKKHVYCEKPLAISEEELRSVVSALRTDAVTLLTVGFNRRYAPMAVQMKSFLHEGEPMMMHYRVNAGYLPSSHWLHDARQGGGRIIGESCHFIDFLCYLTGEIPVSVSAAALPDDERYHQDNVVMTFRFKNGSVGTVSYLANGSKAYPKEFVEVFQNGAVAALNDFRKLELVRGDYRRVSRSRLRQDKGHASSWRNFLETVKNGKSAPIPYQQLIGVTEASFKAVESLKLGKEVEIPDLWMEEPVSE